MLRSRSLCRCNLGVRFARHQTSETAYVFRPTRRRGFRHNRASRIYLENPEGSPFSCAGDARLIRLLRGNPRMNVRLLV